MRKLLIATIVLASLFYLDQEPLYPVYAAESTPSALQVKLKALQDEIASRAATLKKEISTKLQNKVYIGTITEKTTTSLTLGGSKSVSINEFTEYFDDKDRKITIKNISVENAVAALGDINDKEVLTAKRIIKLASAAAEEKQVVGGTVTTVDPQSLSLKGADGQTTTVPLSAQTTYQFGDQEALRSDIKLGKQVIAVLVNEKTRFVYIVPTADSSPAPKVASPSATPKTSAKPSPSPTPKK